MKAINIHLPRIIVALFKGIFLPAVLISVLILFPVLAHGAQVTLAWDANSEPDVAGYNLYYGTAGGQ